VACNSLHDVDCRGVIAITNRKGLEDAACECYGIVKRAFDEILPPVLKRQES
jgi:hypothetical protein